jgi:hypothetical protein
MMQRPAPSLFYSRERISAADGLSRYSGCTGGTPTYWARGRISRPVAYCSMASPADPADAPPDRKEHQRCRSWQMQHAPHGGEPEVDIGVLAGDAGCRTGAFDDVDGLPERLEARSFMAPVLELRAT